MPFGLTGAPSTFDELIAIALKNMIGRELANWMDDICMPGDHFETKLANLRKFFTRCRDKNLSLSPSKTNLFFTEVLFAGAVVGPSGIKPNLDKVAAVVNWPEPQDVQDLMAFLGLTNYFRRLINDYARIAAPLTDLTRNLQVDIPKTGWKARKGVYKRALKAISLKDKWTPRHQEAFLALKIILSQEPILRSPQYDGRVFRITTDGSGDGLAGWLSQPFEETDKNGNTTTRWYPISYCSKRTSVSESRYEPFLLEFAALKYSIDEFKPYIFGSPIEIETDCQALRDCLLKDKLNTHHSRWMESILSHNIVDIRHRPGIQNPVADGLSRMWRNRKRSPTDGSTWSVLPDWEASKGIQNDVMSILDSPHPTEHPLITTFKGDMFFAPVVNHLLGKTAGDSIAERRKAMHRAEGFMLEDNKLWRVSSKTRDRVPRTECIPATRGFQLALDTHKANGHFSADILKLHLRDRYFWPGLDTDCRQACIECSHCKGFGPAKLNALLQLIRRVRPFDLMAGDYVSLPTGKGGFKTLGVYIDTCSNFVWVSKIKSAGTRLTTRESLQRICLDYATPRAFMSDGGSHFKNGTVDEFCDNNNIQHIVTPAYAPWVNGLVESTNNLLLSRLKRLCAPDLDEDPGEVDPKSIPWNWPEHLDEAVRAINDRIIPALNTTPREILFGMALHPDTNSEPPLTPQPTSTEDLDTHFTLTDSFRYNTHIRSLTESQRKKEAFDSKALVHDIKIGSLVQVYDNKADFNFATINKLAPRWSVPRLITGKYLNSFTLSTLQGIPLNGLFHIRRLRPYIPLRGSTLDIIHPRDIAEPSLEDLEIAEAEERMMDDAVLESPSGT
jgi:transposase InsO family protein